MAANYANSNFSSSPSVSPQSRRTRNVPLPPVFIAPRASAGTIKIPPLSALRNRSRTEQDIVVESEDDADDEDEPEIPIAKRKIAGNKRVTKSMATSPRTYSRLPPQPLHAQVQPASQSPPQYPVNLDGDVEMSDP